MQHNALQKSVFILLAICIASLTAAGIVYFVSGGGPLFSFQSIQEKTLSDGASTSLDRVQVVPAEGIEQVSIRAVSSDVKIEFIAEAEFEIQLSGEVTTRTADMPELITRVSGNTLEIRVRKPEQSSTKRGLRFGKIGIFSSHHLNLRVALPASYQSNLSVHSVSGDISIPDGSLNTLSVKTTSGDILIHPLTTKDMTIATVSGDINAHSIHTAQTNIKTVSGDIRVDFRGFEGDTSIKTTSGDVSISTALTSAFHLSAHSTSGSLKCQRPITMTETKRQSLQGSVGDDPQHKFQIRTISGNIRVQ